MTKTTKKVVKKSAKKVTKKKVAKTFYALMGKSEGNFVDLSGEATVMLLNPKSDHMNHVINSYLQFDSEDGLKNTYMVKVEILGQPLVKTTREITIKK